MYVTANKDFTKISDGIFEAKINTKDQKYNIFRVMANEICGKEYQYSVILAYYFINHTNIES